MSLQPLPDLGLVPLTDNPEATFEMIAAANLQPGAPQEPDCAPDLEDEESAEALEPQSELEEDIDLGPEDEAEEEEEILFAEVLCALSPRVFSDLAPEKFYLALWSVCNESQTFSVVFRRRWHQQRRSPKLLRLQFR